MMAGLVYFVCAAASTGCAVLLVRSWRTSRVRLLLWTAIGFTGLAVNNVLLFIDRTVILDRDLQTLRDITGLGALAVLLFGLIWESR